MSVSRIYRILRLITMLQSGQGFTADELARELEVSRRTIFRDLNMLELAHIPYYFDGDRQCYRISGHFFLPPVNLTVSEALAMLLLAGRLRTSEKLPLLAESSRAAVKLESALPDAVRRHVGSVIDRVSVSLGPVSRHEGLDGMFDELAGAIAGRRVCRIVYLSFLERQQLRLDVHPLRLVFRARAWYLLAYSARHRQVRTFKLGRIRKLTTTLRTFVASPEGNEEDHFDGAWGMIPEGRCYDVHLHFEPMVAGNVAEVRWHPTQRVQWNEDGSAEFHATVNGLGEISWWVLGYGDQAEVVHPPELRERIAQTAGAMLRKYEQDNHARPATPAGPRRGGR